MRFDHILIADWSAASRPTSAARRQDSIWIAESGGGEWHFRTRAAAERWLSQRLHDLSDRRVLLGFDFAFGWPQGFARHLTGQDDPRGVWAWLAAEITDGPDNANNRFDVAARINRSFGPALGPFWSRPASLDLPDLPARRAGIDYAALGLAEHREAERITRAKPVWMLTNPGAVGSQSLMGQPMLHRLAKCFAAHVWPFDDAAALPRAGLVLAEVYPSLLNTAVARLVQGTGIEKDRAQVRLLARAIGQLDLQGGLAGLWALPNGVSRNEGWILGAGHAELLQRASEAE